ncbi:MAG: substrate-binding domain-containing protein [Clostridiaceae bacterium]|nr:substrate-binding domain-containing protein [Clostridiaceae bacterium]
MKKKRLLAALTAAAMSVTMLAGCGGDKPAAGGSGAASGDDGKLKMTLIMALRDEFLSALEGGCKDAATKAGVELTTQDAQNDTGKMLQYIETARNNGEDAVIINIVDPETAQQCIEAAGDMKVVFVNRSVTEDVYSKFDENACGVWSNEDTSGYYQGEWLANHFKEQGKTDVKYIMMCGTLGQVYTTKRTEGAIKALKDNGINPIPATSDLVGEYDRATAMDQISPLIDTTDYDCVICNNDAMALGVIEAMKAKGIDPSTKPVVGIDATVDGVEAVKNGEMAMTVFQDPVGQGFGAVMAAANMCNGEAINANTDFETDETGRLVWVPFEPVYQDNVADYE